MADTTDKDREKSTAKSVSDIKEQRKLMDEISIIAAKMGVEFEKHSKSIGTSVKDLTKIDKIQAEIKSKTRDVESIQLRIFDLMKEKVKLENESGINFEKVLELRKKLNEAEDVASKAGIVDISKHDKIVSKLKEELKHETSITSEHIKRRGIILNELKNSKNSLAIEEKLLSQKSQQEHKQKFLNSLMDKFFGNTIKNLESSDFVKGFGLSGFIGRLGGPVLFAIAGVTKLITHMFNIFVKFDNEMFSLRKHFGLFRNESEHIEKTAKNTALNYAKLGVTIEMSSSAIKSIGDNFGLLSSYTQEIVDNISLLSASLGISEKTSSDMLNTLSGISGKALKDASVGMIGFTKELSKAAGTNLNQVMLDIGNASDSVRSTFKGNTIELIKATVEARRMGLSLESLAKSSESLLDFNSSVNAEMEASVLLGKNLNLNEARRKAFNGDILGANKEILRVVKSAGDFDSMNMMQKKALASATGKSVEELQKMLQREKEIAWIRASDRQDLKDQLSREEELLKIKEDQSKDISFAAEESLKQRSNQTRMNELQQQFNQLILDLGGPILDIIDPMLRLAVEILPKIVKFIKENSDLMKILGVSALVVAAACGVVVAKVILIGSLITAVAVGFYKLGNLIFEWTEAAGEFWGEMSVRAEKTMDGIIDKIKSAVKTIFTWLKSPFESFFNWFYDSSGIPGKSPSEIGLSIVDGITSIGSILIDALIFPFKSAYTFVTELFGKIPEFITSVFKRGFDFVTKLPGMGLLTKAVDAFSGSVTKENSPSRPSLSQTKQDDTNQLILEQLKELTSLLKSGAIAVNMDGRKVSETLAYVSSR